MLQNAPKLTSSPRGVSDASLAHHPAWLCSAPREGAKSISRCLATQLQVPLEFADCKIFLVTLKPTLAKGGTGSHGRLGPGSAALLPCSPRRSPAPAGVLLDRERSAGLSRLANNLQPGMSTTINSLISTDLKKDALLFTRLTAACPGPRAGARSA